jgi:transposase-like protein
VYGCFCDRYMRYSTAAYGDSMIAAAEMDVCGKFDSRLSRLTRAKISAHVGVPEEDIVLMDVDYGGDARHLRHFVAIDHKNKKVVLSIRGTFSLSEIVVDVAAFSSKHQSVSSMCLFSLSLS